MRNKLYKLFGNVIPAFEPESPRRHKFFAFIAVVSLILSACSNDNVAGGASGDAGVVAVKNLDVAGVTQKGPFVTGSAVTVQELDGITLKQTGKSFKGSIKSDKGDFAIKDINLQSQYAILEASGYYRDEVSGKKSSGTVTLRALTDLSNRKTVNINLLTHLEYERVMYLVTEKKMPIADAKAQAEREILASFGIDGDFAESEDLNIFESGDGNAALLAVSVLMQSDVDVAGLTERMGEFSIALAEGGSWDDADTKTAIADWACDVDLKGTLANVRKNVENWKYADTVPAFEKFVTNFWWNNYGLGACNDKRENETKRNVNKLSKLYDEYFVCENGRWVIPGDEKSSSSKDTEPVEGSSSSVIPASSVNLPASSSSSIVSSSSIYNPFASSDSHDAFSPLPEQFSFIDSVYQIMGYKSYGEGKQEVWMARSTGKFLDEKPRDSLAKILVDAIGAKGYTFEGAVKNDSVGERNGSEIKTYDDTSYVYSKAENGTVYKVGITKSAVTSISLYTSYLYIDVKLVVLKEGFKEVPTVDYGLMRYETDLPEEVDFINDYVSEKLRSSYNNDSMYVSWNILHITDSSYAKSSSEKVVLAKEDAAMDSLEVFKAALVENGFVVTETDLPNVPTSYYTYVEVNTADSSHKTVHYVKETALAKYWVHVFVGESYRYNKNSEGSYVDEGYHRYCYVVNLEIRYKQKPERDKP